MPYIKQERRAELDLGNQVAINSGDLNFQISSKISEYLIVKELSYQTINDIVGALEGAKLEFYRRIAAPYEEQKMKENGDVY